MRFRVGLILFLIAVLLLTACSPKGQRVVIQEPLITPENEIKSTPAAQPETPSVSEDAQLYITISAKNKPDFTGLELEIPKISLVREDHVQDVIPEYSTPNLAIAAQKTAPILLARQGIKAGMLKEVVFHFGKAEAKTEFHPPTPIFIPAKEFPFRLQGSIEKGKTYVLIVDIDLDSSLHITVENELVLAPNTQVRLVEVESVEITSDRGVQMYDLQPLIILRTGMDESGIPGVDYGLVPGVELTHTPDGLFASDYNKRESGEGNVDRILRALAVNGKLTPLVMEAGVDEWVRLEFKSVDRDYGLRIEGLKIDDSYSDVQLRANEGETKFVDFLARRKGYYKIHCTEPCEGGDKVWGHLVISDGEGQQ